MHGHAVRAVNRHAHAGHGGFESGVVHDAAAFVLHLHFLLGVAGLEERIDMRQHVERDLMRIDVLFHRLPRGDGVDLRTQLLDGLRARAADRLVACRKDALHAEFLMQRMQRHERDRRGAVRIRDDAFVLLHVRAIDLRDDQRHVRIHAKGARVIHHHRARLHRERRVLSRDVAACAEERHVHAGKGVVAQFLDDDFLAAKRQRLARRPRRGEQRELAHGKVSLLQRLDHFDPDSSGGTDNRDV